MEMACPWRALRSPPSRRSSTSPKSWRLRLPRRWFRSRFRPGPVRCRCARPPPRATPRRSSRSPRRYAEGRGMQADMAEAAKWYEKSAEPGFAPAQYRIGNMYEKGIGVDARHRQVDRLVPRRPPSRATPAPCTISPCSTRWAPTADDRQRRRGDVVHQGRRARRQGQPVQSGHPQRQGRRHEAEPGRVLQMVRAGRQDRRQGRRQQARRDRQRAAPRAAGARPRRQRAVEAEAARSRGEHGRDPRRLAGRRRDRPPAST